MLSIFSQWGTTLTVLTKVLASKLLPSLLPTFIASALWLLHPAGMNLSGGEMRDEVYIIVKTEMVMKQRLREQENKEPSHHQQQPTNYGNGWPLAGTETKASVREQVQIKTKR